jgi:hypothetical protein
MFKKFLAPFLVLSIVLTVITVMGLNHEALAKRSEANQDYFIKPISTANLVIVEPNYGRFYNPDPQVEGDTSGKVLYSSLPELKENYVVKGTKMVRFERKGEMIPNLYVSVSPITNQETLAYGLSNHQDSGSANQKM